MLILLVALLWCIGIVGTSYVGTRVLVARIDGITLVGLVLMWPLLLLCIGIIWAEEAGKRAWRRK